MSETVRFIPSEQREQTRRFDIVIEKARHAIGMLSLSNTFPEAELHRFSAQLDSFFPPRVRHGRISIPVEHASCKTTPLLVVKRGETYTPDSTFIDHTPSQAASAISYYDQLGFPGMDIERHWGMISDARRDLSPLPPYESLFQHTRARVNTINWDISVGKSRKKATVIGRPLVQLNSAYISATTASTLYHEDQHVIQATETPLFLGGSEEDTRISRELEAYDKQLPFDFALVDSDDSRYHGHEMQQQLHESSLVSALCDLNPPEDRYASSNVVKKAIRDQRLNI